MKRKLKKMILGFALLLCISNIMACNKTQNVNISIIDKNGDIISLNNYGVANLKSINNSLYYDSVTKIVYFWNGEEYGNSTTMPTPYYSQNGKMFRYDIKTNSFTEVEDDNSEGKEKKGYVYSYEYEQR